MIPFLANREESKFFRINEHLNDNYESIGMRIALILTIKIMKGEELTVPT
jgi:hypothetical protein